MSPRFLIMNMKKRCGYSTELVVSKPEFSYLQALIVKAAPESYLINNVKKLFWSSSSFVYICIYISEYSH